MEIFENIVTPLFQEKVDIGTLSFDGVQPDFIQMCSDLFEHQNIEVMKVSQHHNPTRAH